MSNYTFIIQNTPKYNLELSTIVNKYSISLRSATGPTGPKGDKGERGNNGNNGSNGRDGLQEQQVINIIENTTIDGGNF